tara:strand:+ start:4533 stop:4985 length:453 start_codon:yes stop_codon:yes gene_type:complete
MPIRYHRLLILNASLILMLGLLTGFGYGQHVIAEVSGTLSSIPGDIRGWRMAHLECLLNSLLILAIAGAIRPLQFSAKISGSIFWGLIVCGWSNAIASTLSTITGGRGTEFTGLDWNSVNHILFVAGVIAIFVAALALIFGCIATRERTG